MGASEAGRASRAKRSAAAKVALAAGVARHRNGRGLTACAPRGARRSADFASGGARTCALVSGGRETVAATRAPAPPSAAGGEARRGEGRPSPDR
ncbi:unnamed protein product [Danaus chrysippus]|uniref:(African queen) hypothetical protein n=1 Tax=Danaus chrysippus TaxID=151541 RepID=A0A8J2QLK0_9NEOP|nr:unnamed protein product [Danaus chrysippus]